MGNSWCSIYDEDRVSTAVLQRTASEHIERTRAHETRMLQITTKQQETMDRLCALVFDMNRLMIENNMQCNKKPAR